MKSPKSVDWTGKRVTCSGEIAYSLKTVHDTNGTAAISAVPFVHDTFIAFPKVIVRDFGVVRSTITVRYDR